ncbi:MAG: hypothetical protein V4447_00570 [Pseudomonadota bacterium]
MKYVFFILITSLCFALPAAADEATAGKLTNLRSKFIAIKEPLEKNQFSRPLVLESQDTSGKLTGDIYAVVDYPLSKVSVELNSPAHWCDVLLLHINTKYCRAMTSPGENTIVVYVGKKTQEELKYVAHIDFNYSSVASTSEYFQIQLRAEKGPMGTGDYLVLLEGLEIANGKTFLHLTYSYSMNFAARMAMLTYLKTVASHKVGFTTTNAGSTGQMTYVGGVRGLVERNTMRYYLAIDSFLGAAAKVPPAAQLEYRLNKWFSATEQYPEQLHEINKDEYLTMKRAENVRQLSLR